MFFLTLSLRHLRRHWVLNVPILLVMAMGSVFASGLPLLASSIAGQTLYQALEDAAVPMRNLEIRGEGLEEQHENQVQDLVGTWVRGVEEVREVTLEAETVIHPVDGDPRTFSGLLYLSFWSFEGLQGLTDVLAGRLPADEAWDEPSKGRVLEVAIGTEAALQMELALGDEIKFYEAPVTVRVVGILAPKDPKAGIWWGDDRLLPFNIQRETGLSQTDTVFISMIVPPEVMQAELPAHEMYWRVLLEREAINVQNADHLRDRLVKLEASLNSHGASVVTGLGKVIQTYQDQRMLAQVSLLLLTVQSAFTILYALGMVSSYLLDRSQHEVSALAGRGYSSLQITGIFAIETALMAFCIALPIGPLIAAGGFKVWSAFMGIPAVAGIPTESWLLSSIVLIFSWLTLAIPLYLRTRHTLSLWQSQSFRPPDRPWWQRIVLDIALLALGGFAYWQLTESGSFVRSAGELTGSFLGSADPILLLGPSLLIMAIALITLRLFPVLLQLLSYVGHSSPGLTLSMGLKQLARSPSGPVRVAILISLTVGLAFFAMVFERSIQNRQIEVAHYLSGADLRLIQSLNPSEAETDRTQVAGLRGVTTTSQSYRTRSRWGEGSGIVVDLLAVEPSSLGQVANFPTGLSSVSMSAILKTLEPADQEAIPIVLSYDAPPRGTQIGDIVRYRIGERLYEFEVRGIIVSFPTLTNPFVITHLPELEERVNLATSSMALVGNRELWLDVEPIHHEGLVGMLKRQAKEEVGLPSFQASRIADDTQARLATFQNDLVARTAITAFRVNAITLGVLSVGGFILVQVFAALQRRKQFSVLRALGFSTGQFTGVIFIEGVMLLSLGILLGLGIGYGLAYLMKPFLSLTLQASLGGATIDRLIVPWSSIGQTLLLLVGFDVMVLIFLLIGLLRSKIHQTLRVSEE